MGGLEVGMWKMEGKWGNRVGGGEGGRVGGGDGLNIHNVGRQ